MDLQVLKYFSAVSHEGSFLRASQKLNYAQSNLSTKIKNLEKEFAVKLFHRTSQGVTLTEKGELLLAYADKLLQLSYDTENAMHSTDTTKQTLSISTMESAAVTFVPDILIKYHQANPEIALTINTDISKRSLAKLLEHTIDGAFVAGATRHEKLSSVIVRDEELSLITNNTLKNISTKQLLQQPLLVFPQGCSYRQILENWLEDEQLVPARIIEFNSLSALFASISAGLGIGLFPKDSADSFTSDQILFCHEIPEKYRYISVKFVWRKKSWMNLSLQKFIQLFS
ncbi:LysR family transcriptional regulator [Pectinatus haikarae]|uniref:DNA-binding transcriptional LysR family regulator n=1 Tax=Pectinatus haikarae TaxID=349096 RepID=A0ABT9Y3D9_9FIRM|nr:LysR family transcriptional regulator [Pectinatus haikarae]MDQ0202338.1 DNA-binding transcriptional LysR family regulator [Pectinatus haikarae]